MQWSLSRLVMQLRCRLELLDGSLSVLCRRRRRKTWLLFAREQVAASGAKVEALQDIIHKGVSDHRISIAEHTPGISSSSRAVLHWWVHASLAKSRPVPLLR